MKKFMTLLLLTLVGISSLKAVEQDQIESITATGDLDSLFVSRWLIEIEKKMERDEEVSKRHKLAMARIRTEYYAPGTKKWRFLRIASILSSLGLISIAYIRPYDTFNYCLTTIGSSVCGALVSLSFSKINALEDKYQRENEKKRAIELGEMCFIDESCF